MTTDTGADQRDDFVTPDTVATILVDRWKALNEEAERAEKIISERGITPEAIQGKSESDLRKLLGDDTYELISRAVKNNPTRLRMNKKAEAVMNKVPGASWF